MKVSTNIHAGNLAETTQAAAANVARAAQMAGGVAVDFYNTAQDQAKMLVDGAAGVFTGFWNGVGGLFS